MSDHRAEQIVATVKTKLTGLATTGSNVFRGRGNAIAEANLPAISLYLGDDKITGQYTQAKIDGELTINVEAVVKTSASQVDTVLNQIRKEIAVALHADYTQGLSFVMDTVEGDASAPEISGEGEKPAAAMKLEWKFNYRRSRSDPSA